MPLFLRRARCCKCECQGVCVNGGGYSPCCSYDIGLGGHSLVGLYLKHVRLPFGGGIDKQINEVTQTGASTIVQVGGFCHFRFAARIDITIEYFSEPTLNCTPVNTTLDLRVGLTHPNSNPRRWWGYPNYATPPRACPDDPFFVTSYPTTEEWENEARSDETCSLVDASWVTGGGRGGLQTIDYQLAVTGP